MLNVSNIMLTHQECWEPFQGSRWTTKALNNSVKKTGFGVVGMMILTHKWWRARVFHGKSAVKVDFSCLSATQDTQAFGQVLSLSTKTLYHSLKSEKEDCSCTSADRAKASVWSWRCSSFPPSDQQVMNVTFVLHVSTKSRETWHLFFKEDYHKL